MSELLLPFPEQAATPKPTRKLFEAYCQLNTWALHRTVDVYGALCLRSSRVLAESILWWLPSHGVTLDVRRWDKPYRWPTTRLAIRHSIHQTYYHFQAIDQFEWAAGRQVFHQAFPLEFILPEYTTLV